MEKRQIRRQGRRAVADAPPPNVTAVYVKKTPSMEIIVFSRVAGGRRRRKREGSGEGLRSARSISSSLEAVAAIQGHAR